MAKLKVRNDSEADKVSFDIMAPNGEVAVSVKLTDDQALEFVSEVMHVVKVRKWKMTGLFS